jgi:hypothetical protein
MFDEADLLSLQKRFGKTVGVSFAIRSLVKEYLKNPTKFGLCNHDVGDASE